MFKQIFQRFLNKFFLANGRGPGTPAEWMSIQDDAVRHLNKTKGAPSIKKDPFQGWDPKIVGKDPVVKDFNVPSRNKESKKTVEQFKKNTSPEQWEQIEKNLQNLEEKITIDDVLKGPVRSKGPKGDRIWDLSQKKGEVIPFPDKGIRSLIKKGDIQVGKAPKTKKSTLDKKKDRGILLRDADEAIAEIKRKNKQAVEDFKKKFHPKEPDKFQFGGIAPLIGDWDKFKTREAPPPIKGDFVEEEPSVLDPHLEDLRDLLKREKDKGKLKKLPYDYDEDDLNWWEYPYNDDPFERRIIGEQWVADGGRIGRYEGGIAPLVGEPSYSADFYDDRIPMAGGGGLFKFIEKLFIKASNDIRLGRGKFKGLDQKQKMVQHDNLTKMVEQFQKTKKLPEGAEQYFGVDAKKAFAAAEAKAKRLGKGKNWKEKEVKAQTQEQYLEDLDKRIMDEMDLTKSEMDNMSSTALDDLRRNADPIGMEQNLGEITSGRGVGDFADDPNFLRDVKPVKTKKDRAATADELEEAAEILDPSGETGAMDVFDEGSVIGRDPTKNELDKMLQDHKDYVDDMYQQYKRGDLDKYVKPEELEKQRLFRQKKIDNVLAKAYDEVFYQKPKSGDYKYDADVLADSIAEQLGKGSFTDLPQTHQTQIYNTALKRVTQDMQMKRTLKDVEQKMQLSDFDPKDRLPNQSGGPVDHDALVQMYLAEGLSYEEAVQAAQASANLPWDTLKKAEGGRIEMGTGGITKLLKGFLKKKKPEPKEFIWGVGGKKIDLAPLKKKHGLDPESLKKKEEAFKLRLEEILAKHSTKHAEGGRIGYAGGGQAGLPAVTLGMPQGAAMQQPQMPAGPQPAGIPGGTIVAQNQMQQAPWMGQQMNQGIGGMPRPQPGGMPRPMAAEGGRIGFSVGGFDKARRAFLKMVAGITGAGIAGGTGLLKFGKAAKVAPKIAETTEVIARGPDGIPTYALDLIEVVKAKGTKEIMEGIYKRNPPSTKYNYKGVEVTEDGLGNTSVRKEQTKTGHWYDEATDDSIVDDYVDREVGFEIKQGEIVKGKDGKPIKAGDEYNESTAYMQGEPDGSMDVSEVLEVIDDADHLDLKKIADEIGDVYYEDVNITGKLKRPKKASGGLAYALGE